MKTLLWVLGSAPALLLPLAASAHHSQAAFDRTSQITLQGVVTRYEWTNPHVYIYMNVESESGEPVTWEVEGGPPAILRRSGWSSESLSPGDRISVTGSRAKDHARRTVQYVSIEKHDGSFAQKAQDFSALLDSGAASDAKPDGLSGTWATILNPPVLLGFNDPGSWELTERGREAYEGFDLDTMNPALDCVATTAPYVMLAPDIKSLEVTEEVVKIRGEFNDIERVVHMSVESHDGAVRSRQGHSIGHWEGETLVVDTAAFLDHRTGNAAGLPSGASKHLVERFSLASDGATLRYEFELEDPDYLLEPVRGAVQWAYRPDVEYAAVECDRDIARRFLK